MHGLFCFRFMKKLALLLVLKFNMHVTSVTIVSGISEITSVTFISNFM